MLILFNIILKSIIQYFYVTEIFWLLKILSIWAYFIWNIALTLKIFTDIVTKGLLVNSSNPHQKGAPVIDSLNYDNLC